MSEMITAILTLLAVSLFAAFIGAASDDQRVKLQRFEHKGQIFMLVPAKLQPVTTP